MNMKKLQRPVNSCGLGFPNLLYYYYAFSLRHLAHWALPPERVPPWYNMEQSVRAPLPLIHCLSTNLSKEMKAHPVISHLQRAWKRVSGLMKFDPYLNSASTIWRNPKFNINKKTFIWKEWVEKGILRLEHLYGTDTLNNNTIYLKLNSGDIYNEKKLFGSRLHSPRPADKLHTILIFNSYWVEVMKQLNIIRCWWNLEVFRPLDLSGKEIWGYHDEQDWVSICGKSWIMSRDLRVRLIQFKILNRFYWTQSRLFRLGL